MLRSTRLTTRYLGTVSRFLPSLLLAAAFMVVIACGSTETVIQTVIVEKQVAGQTVIETVIVTEKGDTVVVTEKGDTVVETVIVTEKGDTVVVTEKGDTVVETVIVTEKGDTVVVTEKGDTIVQTVIVEREVEKSIPQTVVVERTVIVEAPAAQSTRQSGKLTVAMNSVQSPITDPQSLVFPTATMMVGIGIQESLFRWGINATGQGSFQVPNLAQSWEVSSDQSTLTLHLRPGTTVRAWDQDEGRVREWGDLTAEDVAWVYNRAGADNIESRHDQADVIHEVYEPFTALDEYVVRAPFKVFRGDFIDVSMSESVGIQSKTVYDARSKPGGPTMPDTTGPFVVRNWLPSERIELVSVVDHWRKSPQFAELEFIEVPEAFVRAAMLKTGEADIAPVSVADVTSLQDAGIEFNDAMKQFQGLWIHFAGNMWMTKDEVSGDPVDRTLKDLPWVGDPFQGGAAFDLNTASMVAARKVREALALAIDRDLLAETILGGYGGPNYRIFNDAHPEFDEKWKIPFDPDRAQALLGEAGYPNGFDMELWCPLDVGNDQEICEAISSMWQRNLDVDAQLSTTVYTANRPMLVDRTFTTPWVLPWGSNRNSGQAAEPGGTYPGCCRWPTIGFNIGYEDPTSWDCYQETRGQEKGSTENMASRALCMDGFASEFLETGVVDFPNLIGIGGGVAAWELRPLQFINSFETIVLK